MQISRFFSAVETHVSSTQVSARPLCQQIEQKIAQQIWPISNPSIHESAMKAL
jgi:hypothetical protein